MNYLKLIYNIISVIAIVFFVFHPKDVVSFWWVSIKRVASGTWKLIKSIFKK